MLTDFTLDFDFNFKIKLVIFDYYIYRTIYIYYYKDKSQRIKILGNHQVKHQPVRLNNTVKEYTQYTSCTK